MNGHNGQVSDADRHPGPLSPKPPRTLSQTFDTARIKAEVAKVEEEEVVVQGAPARMRLTL
jgi:hypothetical protein